MTGFSDTVAESEARAHREKLVQSTLWLDTSQLKRIGRGSEVFSVACRIRSPGVKEVSTSLAWGRVEIEPSLV